MTAHAMSGDRDLCLAAGMDGYISKPINLQKLVETIERVHLRREPAASPNKCGVGPEDRPFCSHPRSGTLNASGSPC